MEDSQKPIVVAAVCIAVIFTAAQVVLAFSPVNDKMLEVSGGLAAFLLAIVGILKLLITHKEVKEVHGKVDKVLNGEMDAKIERVVRRVLDEYTKDRE